MWHPSRMIVALVILALFLPASVQASGGSRQPPPRSPTPTPDLPSPTQTPEEQAVLHYNDGLRMRDKAWKFEEKAATATKQKKKGKYEKKARKQYERAIDSFNTATQLKPDFHEAFSSLGYALRKTGRYENSLAAYDQALSLDPLYTEAIEYRGEAYLGLDRLEGAKAAYINLFASDRPRADQLMAAMQRWLVERQEQPGDLGVQSIYHFHKWIRERLEIAGQTESLSQLQERDW